MIISKPDSKISIIINGRGGGKNIVFEMFKDLWDFVEYVHDLPFPTPKEKAQALMDKYKDVL